MLTSRMYFSHSFNARFVTGLVISFAIMWPFLGRPVDFGIHARFWSLASLSLVFLYQTFKENKRCIPVISLDVIIFALFSICCFLYSSEPQFYQIINPSLSGEYYARKLAIFFYVSLLPALFVLVVSRKLGSTELFSGLRFGFLAITLIGFLIMLQYWDYIFLASVKRMYELKRLNEVSIISLSLIFSIGYLFLLTKLNARSSKRLIALKVFYLVTLMSLVTVLMQRAHLVLLLGITLLFVLRSFSLKQVITLIVVSLVMILMALFFFEGGEFSNSRVYQQWVAVLDGRMFETRLPMYKFALEGISSNMLGHGFGSFSLDFPGQAYPHNFILESFYELGIVGGVLALAITFRILALAVILFLRWNKDSSANREFAFASSITFCLLHQFKAGGIESMGLLLVMWFMAVNYISDDTTRKGG